MDEFLEALKYTGIRATELDDIRGHFIEFLLPNESLFDDVVHNQRSNNAPCTPDSTPHKVSSRNLTRRITGL